MHHVCCPYSTVYRGKHYECTLQSYSSSLSYQMSSVMPSIMHLQSNHAGMTLTPLTYSDATAQHDTTPIMPLSHLLPLLFFGFHLSPMKANPSKEIRASHWVEKNANIT